jgi:hypothetical protein
MDTAPNRFVEAYRRIGDEDDTFDIAFWQAQGPVAIFDAAYELLVDAILVKEGRVEEPRLCRTVESFQRL